MTPSSSSVSASVSSPTAAGGAPLLSLGAGTSSVGVAVGGSIVSLGLGGSSPGLGIGGLGRVAPAAATSTTAALDNTNASPAIAAQPAAVAPDNVEPTSSSSQVVTTTEPEPAATPTDSGAVATVLVAVPPRILAVFTNAPAVFGNNAPNTVNSVASTGNSADSPAYNVPTPANNADNPNSGIPPSGDSTASSINSITVPLNDAATPENSLASLTSMVINNVAPSVDTTTDHSDTPSLSLSQAHTETTSKISVAIPNDSVPEFAGGTVTPDVNSVDTNNSTATSYVNLAQSSSAGGVNPAVSTITTSLPMTLSPVATINTLLQNPTDGIKTVWTIIITTVSPMVFDQPINSEESTVFPTSSGADAVVTPSGDNEAIVGGQSTNIAPASGVPSASMSNSGSSSLIPEGPVTGGEGTVLLSSAIAGGNANTNGGTSPTASDKEDISGDSTIAPSSLSVSPSTVILITPLSMSIPSTIYTALSAPSSFSNRTVTTGESTNASVGRNSSLSADDTNGGSTTTRELTLVESGKTITLTAVAVRSGGSQSASGPIINTMSSSISMDSFSLLNSPVIQIRGRIANNTFTLLERRLFG
ncbi:hypothetical protein MMC27_001435 [Xylographa pallens]|nr:hypothetical protein [Xylographa pallens]